MSLDSINDLWLKTPFGATSVEQQQTTNPAATEGNTPPAPPAVVTTTDEDDDPYKGLTPKELKRMLADAESAKGTTEAEKKALQDAIDADQRKKNDENTNLKNDLDKEKTSNADLRETVRKVKLENEILKDDRWTWHNIDDVIGKLPENVQVDDRGKVSGLAAALTKIAKDNEYLVKSTKDQQQQQNNGNQQQQQNGGPTGFQPGQGGANAGGALPPNVTALARDYPALNSRITGAPQGPPIPVPGPM